MAVPTAHVDFNAEDTLLASELNVRFNELKTFLDDGLGDDNFDEISGTKIFGGAATRTGSSEQNFVQINRFSGKLTIGGPMVFDSLTSVDGDTTPSIGQTSYLKLANTASTDVTTFDDGQYLVRDGSQYYKMFFVEVTEAFSTIKHGLPNILNQDDTAPAGADDVVNRVPGADEFRSRFNMYFGITNDVSTPKWYQMFAGKTE